MIKFWKVVKATGTDAIASTRYPTMREARKMAEGLCRRYHTEYIVLEAIGYCSIDETPVNWHIYSY